MENKQNKSENYYIARDRRNMKKIQQLVGELPPFAEDYFRSIETRTSMETRMKYAYDLRIFFDFLAQDKFHCTDVRSITIENFTSVTETDIEIFISKLSLYSYRGKELSCNERAKSRKLSAVRSLYRYLFKNDLIPSDPSAKVDVPKIHNKEIIRLEGNEIPEIINVAESGEGLSRHAESYNNKTHVRDTAILTLFLGTGIRISELVGLNNDSFNFTNSSFVVQRKGGNKAILYFSDEVSVALQRYLEEKASDPKVPSDEKAMFLSMQYKRISVRAVEILVKKYAKIVSPLKKITPHKLRSTYGTRLYEETGDIYIVADVLGHKDVNTTRKHYAAITENRRRSVANIVKLHDEDDS